MTSIDTAICYLTVRNWITSLLDRLMPRRRYHGHHTEQALDDQWADDINGDVIEYAAVAGHPPWEVHHPRNLPAAESASGRGQTVRSGEPDKLDQLAAALVAAPASKRMADTTVDASLHAAIRAEVDGDYTSVIVDR